ncbi:hypothetical protein F5146DRAFT_1223332 [Armillaria mellea]|nr:hypothetical protein F5146DRAFT_1223332 [Armillaria mellea]
MSLDVLKHAQRLNAYLRMKFIFALFFVLCASATTQALVIGRDATSPALVARDIVEGHAPQIRANDGIWKRKFLASEAEPTQDDEGN